MPVYEFICRKCDLGFEVLVSSTSKETPLCPECAGEEVERVLSVVSVGRTRKLAPGAPPGCAGCPSRGSGSGCPMD